jgi:hypothetical protein
MRLEGTTLDIEPLTEVPAIEGMPEEYRGRNADALQVPVNYLGIVDQAKVTGAIHIRFAKVVAGHEGQALTTRYPGHGRHFVSPSADDMLAFPKGHWRYPGVDRYVWFNDPDDGVMYGFLTPEAIAERDK